MRLGAAQIEQLEKQLGGKNPLDLLLAAENGSLPPLTGTLRILHAAMQKFQHGVSWSDVQNLYDAYVDEGNTYTDLLPHLVEVFRVSGFFKTAPEAEEAAGAESL
ncbi:hypothetical protein D3C73_1408470 [compost metagenome]